MPSLRKAAVKDFESVYRLLNILNPRISKEAWRSIFDNGWARQQDYVGYLLEEDGRAVGFLGYIFSERQINGRTEQFCNMTTWDVEEKFRSESLSLLYPILRMDGVTITNFSASKTVNIILKKLGFKLLDSVAKLVYPNPFLSRNKCEVVLDNSKIEALLNGPELRIFKDHLPYDCFHVLLKGTNGSCYVVFTRSFRKKIPYLVVQHISDAKIFAELINSALIRILLKFKCLYIQADDRMLHELKLSNSIDIKLTCEKLFKSESLQREQIDNLYSELILLGL